MNVAVDCDSDRRILCVQNPVRLKRPRGVPAGTVVPSSDVSVDYDRPRIRRDSDIFNAASSAEYVPVNRKCTD